MISKEVRRRRLVNKLWRGKSSKFRREQQLQKDGYRWVVRNFALRGLNPLNLGRPSGKRRPNHSAIANLAKTLYERFGEFTPEAIARIHQVSHALEQPDPLSSPGAVKLLTDVANTYGLVHEPLPPELPPDVMEIDPHRQRQLKHEAAPSGYTAFYTRLVESGFIQEGDEIPEDPPADWEPPLEGMDEDEPPPDLEQMPALEDPQEPFIPEDDDDFQFDRDPDPT